LCSFGTQHQCSQQVQNCSVPNSAVLGVLKLGRFGRPKFRTLVSVCRPTSASSTAVTSSEPHGRRLTTCCPIYSMYTLRCHFRKDCGEIFPAVTTVAECSTNGCTGTRYTTQGSPRVKALYNDIRDKLSRLARNGFWRSSLPPAHYGDAAHRDLHDVYDGNIINDLRKHWPALHVLYIAMVSGLTYAVLDLGRCNNAITMYHPGFRTLTTLTNCPQLPS
jgi:hypothetical protein